MCEISATWPIADSLTEEMLKLVSLIQDFLQCNENLGMHNALDFRFISSKNDFVATLEGDEGGSGKVMCAASIKVYLRIAKRQS
jgi:hypothetical protein